MDDIIINWWAVVGAAVAYMIIGSLWYGPLFGKIWKRLMNFSDQDMKSMAMTPLRAMSIVTVSALVMGYVLMHFVVAFGAVDSSGAWQLAFWIWLGFIATTQLSGVLWENRSWKLFFLNTLGSLVSLSAMACILVKWG